jgi:hypothetical protein
MAKQSVTSKGRVQKLLQAAIEEEVKQFIEMNEEQLLQCSPEFQGFGARMLQSINDHFHKRTLIITCRVHPGEPQASHMLDGLIKYLLSD